MKDKSIENPSEHSILQHLLKIGLFAVMIVLIAHLFPHYSNSFKYRFEQDKIWEYEPLTAEFDFPIYKSSDQIEKEEKDVLANFSPYYNLDEEAGNRQIARLRDAMAEQKTPEPIRRYLTQCFNTIYKQGIFSLHDIEQLHQDGYRKITIVNQLHVATAFPLDYCFTPKSAYDMIIAGAPDNSDNAFHQLDLNAYLISNLTYDPATSQKVRQSLLAQVTPTQGMVLKGELIIDKGAIIDAQKAAKLRSLKIALEEQGVGENNTWISIAAIVVLIIAFVMLLVLYLRIFRPHLFYDLNTLLFFSILMTIIIAMACAVIKYTSLSIYVVPFAWVPVIIRVFYDSRTALYVHLITSLICSLVAPAPFEFLLLQVCIGMVAVGSLRDMAQRAQLVQTAVWIFLAYCLGYTAFTLAGKGDFHMLQWTTYVYFAVNALLIVFAYGLIYIFEKAFRLISSITLVELTNINSDLMLEFAEKAPGTFQHSLSVSNLAMEAAKRIGANTLLVRTGALYHDIGKMYEPRNFTENQQDGFNPLNQMDRISAAQTVIRHVSEGVTLAQKNHLPDVIIQFIQAHHGTSKTRYFYNMYLNEHPGATIDETIFCYPGPKPQTKETALVMMADAVEARSRSLSEYTEESIAQMVDQMINAQMAEEQFVDTPLTFKDIQDIKRIFTKKLISMNHHRIAYPELNK